MPNVSLIRPMLPEIYLMHKKGRTVCVGAYLISSSYTVHLKTRGHPFKLYKERSYSSARASYLSVRVINVWNRLVFRLIVLTFLLLLPSNRQLNRLILVSFYSAMTIELNCIGRVTML